MAKKPVECEWLSVHNKLMLRIKRIMAVIVALEIITETVDMQRYYENWKDVTEIMEIERIDTEIIENERIICRNWKDCYRDYRKHLLYLIGA